MCSSVKNSSVTANFNKIIIPRQSSFVASLFTQQFTQHKSESGDVSVVALDLVN